MIHIIVIVTRGHRDDGNALKACIGSGAAYIGMIGSKTKVALMRREFIEEWLGNRGAMGEDFCTDRTGYQIKNC